jgi:hypothetical protein
VSLTGDRRIYAKVWEWLTSHPDIWVGKEREGNDLSFAEVLAKTSTTPPGSPRNEAGLSHDKPTSEFCADTPGPTNPRQNRDTTDGEPIELRIYTTVGRLWQAVAGHAVDPKKIPDMEFKLLRIIAAAGPRGISQPDLVRITVQDKRSVPKRTDNLNDKKYIQKTTVYIKKNKTSLCTHRRYLHHGSNQIKDVFSGGNLIFDNLLDRLCEWLKDGTAMTMDELHEKIGAPDKSWERTSLWRAYERLDIVGIIQRFHRTQENTKILDTSGRKRTPKPIRVKCIRLLRQPTAEDRRRYHSVTIEDRNAFRRRLEAQDASASAEHAENEGDDYGPEPGQIPVSEPATAITTDRYTGPIKWNPDVLHTNLLYDIVAESGEAGISTMVRS